MIGADVGLFLKDPQQKVAPSGLMITLRLVNGKLAVPVKAQHDSIHKEYDSHQWWVQVGPWCYVIA